MGPCIYCKKMIWHPGIAERGWHHACRVEAEERYERTAMATERHNREHEKRRLRKAAKRRAEKAMKV